jgi:lysophospholipase L1-like esterase
MTHTSAVPQLPLWKRALFGFILVFVIPIVLILVVEGFGRAVLHIKYGVAGKSYGLWQHDSELGAIHAPNSYNSNSETNNFGFRNKQDVIEPRPANALRVIAYGGSTTFCYNLPTELAWPIRLQELLRTSRNPSDQVLNAGAIMWSLGHELIRAKRDLPQLRPDVVILYSGLNEEFNAEMLKHEGIDLQQALAQGKHGLITRHLDQARWLKRHSVILRYWEYVGQSWLRRGAAAPEEDMHVPAQAAQDVAAFDSLVSRNFNATLAEFIASIRQHGGKPLYVVIGGLPEVGMNRRLLQYSRQGVDVARRLGVPVVDSNEIVESRSGTERKALFSDSGVHWSERGAKLLANLIYERAFKQDSVRRH